MDPISAINQEFTRNIVDSWKSDAPERRTTARRQSPISMALQGLARLMLAQLTQLKQLLGAPARLDRQDA
jgi:hypothetical protein